VAFPHKRPAGLQAFVFNTRRPVFADPHVREALGYAFDFEWTNRILFFGQYTRATSFFNNSELAATGLPGEAEHAILDRFRGRVPDRVFGPAYQPPVTDGSGWPRENLEHAFRLLREAGWVVRDMRLVNEATGRPMSFEILITSTGFERIMLPFVRNLKRLGIDARIRLVDDSQYINRLRSFDFDMAMMVWGQSESPGNEQRDFWSSAAAGQEGSRNYAGIRDPVVDQLIELLITAPDRDALVARTRALDRVLTWSFYVIPAYYSNMDRVLYWDKYDYPTVSPDRGVIVGTWWYDAEKARRLAAHVAEHRGGDAAASAGPAAEGR
jgi:microcin C transport system substrate-binding protein